jgi:hypothetical protein
MQGQFGNTSMDGMGPLGSPILPAMIAPDLDPTLLDTSGAALFDKLKKEHDLAKAIKNIDAEVPIHLWDTAVWALSSGYKTKREVAPNHWR